MNICFVLPQMLRKPVGGYKMVYEYANRLSIKYHKILDDLDVVINSLNASGVFERVQDKKVIKKENK